LSVAENRHSLLMSVAILAQARFYCGTLRSSSGGVRLTMDAIAPPVDEVALGYMDAFIEVCKKQKADKLELREVQHKCFLCQRLGFLEALGKMTHTVALFKRWPPEKLEAETFMLDLQKLTMMRIKYKRFLGAILEDVQSDESFESKRPGMIQAMEDLLELVTADRQAWDKTEDLMEYEYTKSMQYLDRIVDRATFDRQRAAADILVAFRTALDGQTAPAAMDELLREIFLHHTAAVQHDTNSDSDL
jgi:hypothetical protein